MDHPIFQARVLAKAALIDNGVTENDADQIVSDNEPALYEQSRTIWGTEVGNQGLHALGSVVAEYRSQLVAWVTTNLVPQSF